VISAALHVGALALLATRPAPPAMPPMYEVNLIAAPAGPRAVGNVAPVPTAPEPAAAPSAPPRATSTPAPKAVPVPKAAPPKAVKPVPSKAAPKSAPTTAPTATKAAPSAPAAPATEVPVTKAPPTSTTAGGGPTGDKGTDVATVRTEGTAFPFPGYLQNIVRQIALNFRPRAAGALRCDVAFLIHRDGSVSNVRFVSRSGAYAFDLEAQGAIEAAARSRAFGPLPAGFADDVLPVTFSFDPRLVR
jgi:protein TonB